MARAFKVETAEIQPKRLVLKVGTLEIISENGGVSSRVLLDGKPFPARKITVELSVDSLPLITAEFFPIRLDGSNPNAS